MIETPQKPAPLTPNPSEKQQIDSNLFKSLKNSNTKSKRSFSPNGINLNKVNKLRKLKKDIGESEISPQEFEIRLRSQYNVQENLNSDLYKWALEPEETKESTNELDKILSTNKDIINKNNMIYDNTILKYKQIPEFTKEVGYQHNSIMTNLVFHPIHNNIVCTTGLDKKLKIFNIKEQNNYESVLTKSINTIDLPIFSCRFLNYEEILISGRRKYFFIYNTEKNKLMKYDGNCNTANNQIFSFEKAFSSYMNNVFSFSGNNGVIYLYDLNTKKFKYDIKVSYGVNSICFDDNNYMYTAGDSSEINIFDLRMYRTCLKVINDYSNFYVNCLDINNKYLATGGKQGYVNLYSINDLINNISEDVEPLRIYDNLTTSCDFIKFSNDQKILGMGSKWKKNALRFVNLNNLKVYSNFPSYRERVKYPFCLDFSCEGNLIGVGNDEGKGYLYKIEKI